MSCDIYSNASGLPVQKAGAMPSGYCFTTWPQLFSDILEALILSMPGNFAGFVVGSSEPAESDRDKAWLKVSNGCAPLGLFLFYNGSWKRAIPHHLQPGSIIDYYDVTLDPNDHAENSVKISFLDVYDETYTPGTPAVNPFWRVCDGTNGTPDLRGRVRVGAGTGTLLTDRKQGESSGTEQHTLSLSEIPTIQMPISSGVGSVSAFNAGTKTADVALNTGGAAHNNMQPYYVVYPIIRTSRML